MISSELRFHGHNALSFVYRKGRVVRGQYCSLKYVANSRRKQVRIAVVASRKTSKSAVVRNRVRRRVYEQVRGLVPADLAYDLVITVFDERVAEIPEKELNAIIIKLLQMSGVIGGVETAVDKSEKPTTHTK